MAFHATNMKLHRSVLTAVAEWLQTRKPGTYTCQAKSGCSGSGKILVINTAFCHLQPYGDQEGWKFVAVDAHQAQTVQLFCRTVYEVLGLRHLLS